jgi:hypothetical protein
MGRPKEFQIKNHARIVYAPAADFIYLKQQGIAISEFFRQAIIAHKKKKFEYRRM